MFIDSSGHAVIFIRKGHLIEMRSPNDGSVIKTIDLRTFPHAVTNIMHPAPSLVPYEKADGSLGLVFSFSGPNGTGPRILDVDLKSGTALETGHHERSVYTVASLPVQDQARSGNGSGVYAHGFLLGDGSGKPRLLVRDLAQEGKVLLDERLPGNSKVDGSSVSFHRTINGEDLYVAVQYEGDGQSRLALYKAPVDASAPAKRRDYSGTQFTFVSGNFVEDENGKVSYLPPATKSEWLRVIQGSGGEESIPLGSPHSFLTKHGVCIPGIGKVLIASAFTGSKESIAYVVLDAHDKGPLIWDRDQLGMGDIESVFMGRDGRVLAVFRSGDRSNFNFVQLYGPAGGGK